MKVKGPHSRQHARERERERERVVAAQMSLLHCQPTGWRHLSLSPSSSQAVKHLLLSVALVLGGLILGNSSFWSLQLHL